MTDFFDYTPPAITYGPIEEEVTKVLPTGEHRLETVVVGYKASPPPPKTGTNLDSLRYAAALIEVRTGHRVRVAQVEHKIISAEYDDMPVTYEVQTAHALGGPAPYDVMWAWLSGFHNGIEETLRKEGQKQ